MSIDVSHHVETPHASSHGSKGHESAPAPAVVEGGITFDRNLFVNGEAGREVTFSKEMQTKYKDYLTTHVNKLVQFRKWNPDEFQSVLNNPEHVYDKMLFAQFATNEITDHETGEKAGFSVDPAAIDAFLQRSSGWEVVQQVMEHQSAMQLSALGLAALNMEPGQRHKLAQELTTRLGKEHGQGVLNRMWYDKIEPNLGKIGKYGAGAATAMGAGFLVGGGPLGWLGGTALTGAGLAGIDGFIKGIKDGDMVQLRESEGAFNSVARNPAEVKYLKAIHGIDVEDIYFHDGTRHVDGSRISGTDGTHQIQHDLLENLKLRKEWYSALHIPIPDALPGQYLTEGSFAHSGGSREHTQEWRMQRFDTVFNPNRGGIKSFENRYDMTTTPPTLIDTVYHNVQIQNATTKEWEPNPSFNPDNLDYEGNLERFSAAQRTVIVEMLAANIAGERMRKTSAENGPRAIGEKLEKRKETFAKEVAKEKQTLGKKQAELTAQQGKIDALEQIKSAPNEASKSFAREFPAYAVAKIDIPTAITDVASKLSTAKTDLDTLRIGRGAAIDKRTTDRVDKLPVLDTTGMSPADKTATMNRRAELEREIRRDEVAEVDKDIAARKAIVDERTAQLARLNTLQEEEKTGTGGVTQAENAILVDARHDLPAMLADYDTFTASRPAGWEVPEAIVRTGTLAEVMQSLNADYAADEAAGIPPGSRRGWSEGENTVQANRDRAVRVMAEARARFEEDRDPDSIKRRGSFTTIRRFDLSENELRTWREDNLLRAIHGVNAADAAAGIPVGSRRGWDPSEDATRTDELRNAVAEARNRMLVRNQIHTQLQLADVNEQIRRIDERDIDDEYEKLPEVIQGRLALEALGKKSEIISHAQATVVSEQAVKKYFNAGLLDAAADVTEYKPAEVTANFPVGYYELMHVMFGYKDRPDRNEAFERISQALPPEFLSETFVRELGLTPLPPNTPLQAVLIEIQSRKVHGVEMSQAFELLIHRMRRRANTI